jgi:hypothetical protein
MKNHNISRLEIFCSDALVMPIKRMLLGMKGVHEITDQPVINAQKAHSGLTARSSGKTIDMFVDYLRQHKIDTVKADNVRQFQASLGRSESGYYAVIAKALDLGVLKKNKGGASTRTYTVNLKDK